MRALRRGISQFYAPYEQVFARVPGTRNLLLSYVIVSVAFSLSIQLHGPFLRSMVECDTPPTPGARFSGSAYCGDADYVLAVAQTQEGSLVSMKLVVHAIAGPLLGSFADRMGRRPMLLTSLGGYTTAFCLLLLVSLQRERSHPLVVACFFIEGATNAFDVVYMSMIADTTTSADRSTAFAAYFFCSATGTIVAQVASVGLLRLCLESYASVWFALFVVLAADVAFVRACVPETLVVHEGHSEGQPALAALSLLRGPFQLVASARFLRLWLLSVLLTNLASGLSGVLASFSIAVYHWRPGDYQAYTWFNNLLRMASLSLISPHVNRLGSPPMVLLVQILVAALASLVQVFAPYSPVALLGPAYVVDALAFATPANAAFLSSQFGTDQQAKVNAVQHLCSNLGTSLSIALFSSPLMFRPSGPRSAAMRPFVLAFWLSVLGGAIKACLVASHLRRSRRQGLTQVTDSGRLSEDTGTEGAQAETSGHF